MVDQAAVEMQERVVPVNKMLELEDAVEGKVVLVEVIE